MVRVGGGGAKAEDIWNYSTRTLTQTPLTYSYAPFNVLATSRLILPEGILYVSTDTPNTAITVDVRDGISWVSIDDLSTPKMVISDGANLSIYNGTSGTVRLYIFKVV